MEKMFTDVLEKDEAVQKVYRPNGCRFWTGLTLSMLLITVWLLAMPLVAIIPAEGESGIRPIGTFFWVMLGVGIGTFVLTWAVTVLCGWLWLRNRYHAYTNKRILIRSGIIGIDFKSLEFKSMTATMVKVNWLDKLLRKNTGTIRFGSPASPMQSVMSSGGASNAFNFDHIAKPYEVLRELKEFINEDNKDSAV